MPFSSLQPTAVVAILCHRHMTHLISVSGKCRQENRPTSWAQWQGIEDGLFQNPNILKPYLRFEPSTTLLRLVPPFLRPPL
ncbi:hypothetical protein GGX14DRAFT_570647 [Mycena pura]|uniref:Uncharacterized protein n=1 Tax=Mycena pura TaxID=153505 RepID=A0AAD6V0T0_9AGAR|nr:hypothetical protein GGX14DRAFT_572790 [Mycena pura]KAJ7202538.1 hypothetical protein GGX14DRAFT_570647 [Mycena pura]